MFPMLMALLLSAAEPMTGYLEQLRLTGLRNSPFQPSLNGVYSRESEYGCAGCRPVYRHFTNDPVLDVGLNRSVVLWWSENSEKWVVSTDVRDDKTLWVAYLESPEGIPPNELPNQRWYSVIDSAHVYSRGAEIVGI